MSEQHLDLTLLKERSHVGVGLADIADAISVLFLSKLTRSSGLNEIVWAFLSDVDKATDTEL